MPTSKPPVAVRYLPMIDGWNRHRAACLEFFGGSQKAVLYRWGWYRLS